MYSETSDEAADNAMSDNNDLERSERERSSFGVASGLGEPLVESSSLWGQQQDKQHEREIHVLALRTLEAEGD